MKKNIFMLTAAAMLCLSRPASAQTTAPAPQPDEQKIPVVKITLHPAAETRPALKYQLLPPIGERKPGNAAVIYNRIPAEYYHFFADDKVWDDLCNLLDAPLSELRREESRVVIQKFNAIIADTVRAAHYESCDWQIPIRDECPFLILLPEAQQTRSFARALAAKARLQIAEGKLEEALQTLQAGYAFARHVAAGQTVIHGLIGKAIAGLMSEQLRELIQQPGAPNLYWAICSLPRPIVDIRPGLDGEFDAFYLSFPKVRDLEKNIMSVEESRLLLEESTDHLNEIFKGLAMQNPGTKFETRFAALAVILADYPWAKKYLIDGGMAPEKIEAMPVAQVMMISIARHYDEARGDLFKWLYTSDPEALAGLTRFSADFSRKMKTRDVFFSIENIFLPGLANVAIAKFTNEREFAALQTLEALRIYAAAHRGRLPDRLSDITEVPVPLDPTQNKPFYYHAEGNTATLESPNPPGSPLDRYLKYEIRMESNDK
jgi:hypothetical protein